MLPAGQPGIEQEGHALAAGTSRGCAVLCSPGRRSNTLVAQGAALSPAMAGQSWQQAGASRKQPERAAPTCATARLRATSCPASTVSSCVILGAMCVFQPCRKAMCCCNKGGRRIGSERAMELAQAPLAAAPSSSTWAPIGPHRHCGRPLRIAFWEAYLQAWRGLRGASTWFWGVGSAESCDAAIAWPAW